MPKYFAECALLSDGWAENVRLAVSHDGTITSIDVGVPADDAERLAGPVVPGMSNLHSHAFQRAMAGLAERAERPDDSFWTWRDRMYKLVSGLEPEHLESIATYLYTEMLKAGYTNVVEFHYLHHDRDGRRYADIAEMSRRILAAAGRAGIGITLAPVLYSYSGFGARPPNEGQKRFLFDVDGYVTLLSALSTEISADRQQRLAIAFHSLRGVAPGQIDAVLAAAADDRPVHIHIAEQQREVDDCLAWSGQRPIEWLFDHVPVDARWCLIHATHASPHEIDCMADSGAVVGLCPTTEANLGDGLFPAKPFLERSGAFGIGSDSHVSVSVVEELRWLEYGQRLRSEQRNRLASAEVPSIGRFLFGGAIAGGARAAGQPITGLTRGNRADFVVLDGSHPFLAGAAPEHILDRWLFGGSNAMVRDVAVAGRWHVRNGHHPIEAGAAQALTSIMAGLRAA